MAGFYITDDGGRFVYVHLKRDRFKEPGASHSASRKFLARALGQRKLLRPKTRRYNASLYKVNLGRVRLTEVYGR